MPDAPKHPVTVGDLLTIGVDRVRRPATVADLKAACRALDWLVVEKVDGEWAEWVLVALGESPDDVHPSLSVRLLDALAEAQPFPPAGG